MDPRRVLPVLVVAAALCAVLTVVVAVGRVWSPSGADEPTPVMPPTPGPASLLAEWDEQRSAAWAGGDPAALRDLYAAGSRAGAADVRLLRRYADRGLRVTGLRTQLLALEVLARDEETIRLLVTDRIVGGRASGGGESVRLPADRASTRRITLVRRGEVWLVEEVRDQASAAPSTSRTSSSSKS